MLGLQAFAKQALATETTRASGAVGTISFAFASTAKVKVIGTSTLTFAATGVIRARAAFIGSISFSFASSAVMVSKMTIQAQSMSQFTASGILRLAGWRVEEHDRGVWTIEGEPGGTWTVEGEPGGSWRIAA